MALIAVHRLLLAAGLVAALVLGGVGVGSGPGAAVPGMLPLGFFVAGVIAFTQRPQNGAGRFLLAFGALHLVSFAIAAVLMAGAATGEAWAWSANALSLACFNLGFAAFASMLAVFPDGCCRHRGERIFVRGAAAAAALATLLAVIGSRQLPLVIEPSGEQLHTVVPASVHVEAMAPLAPLGGALMLAPLLGLLMLVLRYRTADAEQRRQMRWPLASVALLVLALVTTPVVEALLGTLAQTAIFLVAAGTLPVSLIVGMLRHRLLDVDLVIRRSAAYVVLWSAITIAYAVLAALPGIAVGRALPVTAAVVATIAAAMLFQPLRRRLEHGIDRLVFGHRPGGVAFVNDFGRSLEGVAGTSELGRAVSQAVRAGIGADWVRVELGEPLATVELQPALEVPMAHGGVLVGRILCGPRRSRRYGAADEELLTALAHQAALAFRNAMLADDLARQLRELDARSAELAASRRRIVESAEEERRRIERDLHDGIQQELIALMAGIGLARAQLRDGDHGAIDGVLLELSAQVRETHASVRELAQGIHPGVLSDRGLYEAVSSRAARLPLRVSVQAADELQSRRFAPEVEGAAFFVACEALANVVKHARCDDAHVRLTLRDGQLVVEVWDDGVGCDDGQLRQGTGIQGLRDRVEALGGIMEVGAREVTGAGLRVQAALPLDGAAIVTRGADACSAEEVPA